MNNLSLFLFEFFGLFDCIAACGFFILCAFYFNKLCTNYQVTAEVAARAVMAAALSARNADGGAPNWAPAAASVGR